MFVKHNYMFYEIQKLVPRQYLPRNRPYYLLVIRDLL